jgi:hypothetical protein
MHPEETPLHAYILSCGILHAPARRQISDGQPHAQAAPIIHRQQVNSRQKLKPTYIVALLSLILTHTLTHTLQQQIFLKV